MPKEDWRDQSRCKTLEIPTADSLFWLGKGGSPMKAKALCDECPVKRMCLNYSIVHEEVGIWGGTTEKERREILAEMPDLKEKLTEKARQEGWLEEHRWVPIVLVASYLETTQSQFDEDVLFDNYLSTLPQTDSLQETA
jgi:WhiB family redox-sensing transcriptional regulator